MTSISNKCCCQGSYAFDGVFSFCGTALTWDWDKANNLLDECWHFVWFTLLVREL